MNWLDIIVIIILILTFIGGMKDGAIKVFFSLLATVISIPLAGLSYRLIASILSFLPGTNWENFFGFFITMGIIIAILQLIFRRYRLNGTHTGAQSLPYFRLAGKVGQQLRHTDVAGG